MRQNIRWVSLLLCLLFLLSACGKPAEPTGPDLSPQALAEAIAASTGDVLVLEPDRMNSQDRPALAAYLETAYGLEDGEWTDGAVVLGLGAQAYEIAVLTFPDGEGAEQGQARLEQYKKDRKGAFAGYAPEQAELVEAGIVARQGRYVGLFLCQDPEAARDLFLSALEQNKLPSVPTGTGPSPEGDPTVTSAPQTDPEPTWQADRDPVFVRMAWGTPTGGTPDPDYPGRIRFTSPGKDDMSLYDTSAIRAAWETGDPSALSEYDRTIYDSAARLLGQILREDMGDYQKEVAVYAWIVQNVNYDWTHTEIMTPTPRESFTPYGGLVNRTAVCLGYATTFQLLMDLAGVECITVVGASEGSSEDHAWNMVCLEGEWYCVDVTWDANFREYGTLNGWEWSLFNVTDQEMVRSNHQWDYAHTPAATAEDHGIS